ncbi:MAG: LON peptidase substrate-binding domain-containing protein [Verrucomicrobiales bacterium]|nr:LON peptidase substrate-binding domain-containing protein [Verrucomicrobiales bacterium]
MRVPTSVPVMVLQNVILFPQAMLPLYIFEPRYRRLLADTLRGNRMMAVTMRKPGSSQERAERIGGLGLVRACVTHDDGTSHLVLQGLARVQLEKTLRYQPYRVSVIRPLDSMNESDITMNTLAMRLMELVRRRLANMPASAFAEIAADPIPSDDTKTLAIEAFERLLEHLNSANDPEQIADLVSATLLADPVERQLILETAPVVDRLRHLIRFLSREFSSPPEPNPEP